MKVQLEIAGVLLAALLLAGCGSMPASDPASDAPDVRISDNALFTQASSYPETLKLWRSPEQVNAWIGARFEYDPARAMRLSETQRKLRGRLPIHAPEAFFTSPRGICVDLARFGVETLRAVDPASKPIYVMIEFDPVQISGTTLRRHWVVTFERDGQRYFFADSKRPGHLAGPYASTQAYIDEYAKYRGRRIVAFRELQTYERRARAMAGKQYRND